MPHQWAHGFLSKEQVLSRKGIPFASSLVQSSLLGMFIRQKDILWVFVCLSNILLPGKECWISDAVPLIFDISLQGAFTVLSEMVWDGLLVIAPAVCLNKDTYIISNTLDIFLISTLKFLLTCCWEQSLTCKKTNGLHSDTDVNVIVERFPSVCVFHHMHIYN